MYQSEPLDDANSAAPKRSFRWRRLFQFRLRTLLIVMTLCGVGFGMLGRWLLKVRQQRTVVAEIRQAGGQVRYNIELGAAGLAQTRHAPKWLVDSLGVDYFDSVWEVDGHQMRVTKGVDIEMERIKFLTELKWLSLGGTVITDAALAHVQRLKGLKRLDIVSSEITDAGLNHLQGLESLEILLLMNTQVTDAGVERLKQSLPNCHIYRDRKPPTESLNVPIKNRNGENW